MFYRSVLQIEGIGNAFVGDLSVEYIESQAEIRIVGDLVVVVEIGDLRNIWQCGVG